MKTKLRPAIFTALAGLLACGACTIGIRHIRLRDIDLFVLYGEGLGTDYRQKGEIEIALPDGNVLRGITAIRPKPAANVLYFGGNGEMAQISAEKIAAWSELYNINVIFVDYQGYGASSGVPTLKGLGGNALSIFDATADLRGDAPTLAVGYSLGSLSASYLAAHRPVRGLVLMAPISSFTDEDLTSEKQMRRALRGLVPWFAIPLTPFVKVRLDIDLPETSEPLHLITRVSAPLLLMHGTADTLIPSACGVKVYERARARKDILLLPGLGHNDLSLSKGPCAERFASFLASILPQPQPEPPKTD